MTTIDDVFHVRYGHSLELNRLEQIDSEHGIAFVSRKMGDNGVSAFVRAIPDVEPASAGELTVALGGNGVLSTFLQERPFYTGRDVAILSAKSPLSKAAMLYYCMCVKANRYRYNYGRQANRSLRSIAVPSPRRLPSWVGTTKVDRFDGAMSPKRPGRVALPPVERWRAYRLSELFDMAKGKRLTKAEMLPGSTPFIGAIDNSNGLTAFVAQPPLHPGNTIGVNYNGNGVAEAFYQPVPYRCSDDVNVLSAKFKLTPAVAMFVITVIRQEKYRFNYGRKWHLERMSQSEIRLPAKANGAPDWSLMERFIDALPFSSQL